MKTSIILTGFMGSGKTTAGEYLAKHYQCEIIDTDKWIENKQNQSVTDIFNIHGEKFFRDLETKCLKTIKNNIGTKKAIIATGGGLPLRETNRRLLKELGKAVYLKTSPGTIYRRLENDKSRPLLNTRDPELKITEMIKEREPVYTKAADYIIETDNLSVTQIINEIIKFFDLLCDTV